MQQHTGAMVRCEVGCAVRAEVEHAVRSEVGAGPVRAAAQHRVRFDVAIEPPAYVVPAGFHVEVVTYQGAPVTHLGELVWMLVPNA